MSKGRVLYSQWLVLALLLAIPLLTGCDGSSTTNGGGGSGRAAEPTGGQWKPVVLNAGNVFSVPAPPAANSAQVAQELQELQTMQGQRTRAASSEERINFWEKGASVRWNEIARSIIARRRVNPVVASRVYALLCVAQYDALISAYHYKYLYNRAAPSVVDSSLTTVVAPSNDPVYPSEHAVVAASSAVVLKTVWPDEGTSLEAQVTEHEESRLFAGVNFRSDITAGDTLGRTVAQRVMENASTDGANAVWNGTVPTGAGKWFSSANPPVPPLLPLWGNVRPWLMTSGSQFRPAAPPAFGSAEFQAALAEVRQISNTRTQQQLDIAMFWADGPGTVTPPGHWNQIGCDLIAAKNLNELRAARALALMNMAVMDAGICCWDAKYVYWLIRPSQADTAITTPPGLPNFPSYTSGHSTFSGAAADVLGYIFPDQTQSLREMAEEAAISRVYGGIHYKFDSDIGLTGGRAIAQLAIQRGQADGSP